MTEIVVRRASFEFPDTLDDIFPGDDPVSETYLAAFSLTMPMLEPYLIRTYRAMAPGITDPELAHDVQQFIRQEAQHHKNHAKANAVIHARLAPEVSAALTAIEDRLERDYRRYTAKKSHRFNSMYAEGFEAMTCAMAMASFEKAAAEGPKGFGTWQQLWAWHAAEEIEHRTVAFDVYRTQFGSYPYRVFGSIRAQVHFSWCVARLQRELLAAQGHPRRLHLPSWLKGNWRRYLRTFSPRYHPASLDPGPLVPMVLSMFTPG